MQTHVTTTILDDSISGDAIDGGDISNLNSLQCAILLISGDASSIILNTTIGSSTLAECASIYGNTIRAFNSLSMLSSTGAALFEVYESGALSVRANYYDGATNFAKISKAYIELSPTSLRLMASSAAPSGYQVRAGQNWYFSDATTANLYTLVVRGNSTIPTGTLGGVDIASLATNCVTMYGWYSAFNATTRTYLALLSAPTAASLLAMNGAGGIISTSNWDFVRTLDQHVSLTSNVLFYNITAANNIGGFGNVSAAGGMSSGDLNHPVMWKYVWGTLTDVALGVGSIALDSDDSIISTDTFLGFMYTTENLGYYQTTPDAIAYFSVDVGIPYMRLSKTGAVWNGILIRVLVYYKPVTTTTLSP